jgi:hypothetical protein
MRISLPFKLYNTPFDFEIEVIYNLDNDKIPVFEGAIVESTECKVKTTVLKK